MTNFRRILWEAVQIIVIALVLNLLLRTFVIETRLVPTGSMIPTIQPGDRLLVDKIYYKLSGPKATKGVKRGDIITFDPPAAAFRPGEEKGIFTKRVIGLPGDKVELKPGDGVYVNGKKLDEPYVNDILKYGIMEPSYFNNSTGPFTVPQGNLFVLGDNRNNSRDSRYWGYAKISKVTGEPFLRIWPLNRFGSLK